VTDSLSPAERSANMSRIRGKDTEPELVLRRALHAEGFRFRLHRRDLPGRPDLVLPKHKAVIFVHGCFWHAHDGCVYATMPATRAEFWRAKFYANRQRDAAQTEHLFSAGWRVLTVWECALRRVPDRARTAAAVVRWIRSARQTGEIAGK
jgi:DNA mismatch endonuclease, patch repair protein